MSTTVTDHLRTRHLDLSLHRPVVDNEEGVATFFLYNLSGQLVGYQQYRPGADKKAKNHPKDGRYFTYRKQPTVAVWGVESLHLTPHIVFVTEGVFDACRLTEKGVSALAVLSNDPTTDVGNFLRMLARRVVVVADNDKAGKRLAKFGDVAVFTDGKDLGDADESYVDYLIEKYCKKKEL
jgi:hypothetical protein